MVSKEEVGGSDWEGSQDGRFCCDAEDNAKILQRLTSLATNVRHRWDHNNSNLDPRTRDAVTPGQSVLVCPFCRPENGNKVFKCLEVTDAWRFEHFGVVSGNVGGIKEVCLTEKKWYSGMRDGTAFKTMRKHVKECVKSTPEAVRLFLGDPTKTFPPTLWKSVGSQHAEALDACLPPFFRLLTKEEKETAGKKRKLSP